MQRYEEKRRKSENLREKRRKSEKNREKSEKIREFKRKTEKNQRNSEKIGEIHRKTEKIGGLSVNFRAYPQELSVNLCSYP